MSSLKYYILFSLFILSSLGCYSQRKSKTQTREEAEKAVKEDARQATTADSITSTGYIDYGNFKLPPLSVLFENARSNPSIAILEKEKQLQEKLLSKEKKAWMTYFSAHGSYSYGISDNYGTSQDASTPMIFYQYSGVEQSFWNVGASVSLPLEGLFDLKGRVQRQKIAVDRAELSKEQAFDQLKQQIIHFYVTIQSNLENLKHTSKRIALYKGVSANTEEEFRNRKNTIDAVASAKSEENEANITFENLKSTINEQILILEIISRTEIVHKAQ